MTEAKKVKDLGYKSNKDVIISRLNGIEIKKFRSFKNTNIKLGKYISILVGRNATMKTSMLGLIAHPFSTNAKDCFDETLKTDMSSVFRLSTKYDDDYEYELNIEDNSGNIISEPVKIYKGTGEKKTRHRIVVSGAEKGDGNFNYNTSFISLARLNPMVGTNAEVNTTHKLTKDEQNQLVNFYERIFPGKAYQAFEGIQEGRIKETFGPSGENAQYDFNSISSGEDNLGAIFNKMIGFQRIETKDKNTGNGVFCLDEIEAGLHPAAQIALFKYLLEWCKKHRIQVVFTTHSLHLIETIYREFSERLKNNEIILNFISCSTATDNKNYPIFYNPDFALAYKELTLKTPEEVVNARKVKVFCEDDRAAHFIKKLLKKRTITNKLEFFTNKDTDKRGIEYSSLGKICTHFPILLTDAFVIFDADVAGMPEFLKKIKDKNIYAILPDEDKYPIEKRIAVFIVGLDKGDYFFKRFQKEQDSILGEMAESKIRTNLTAIKSMNNDGDIKKFKNWADNDNNFNKYVTYYSDNLVTRGDFQKIIIARMNHIYSNLGLPLIEID